MRYKIEEVQNGRQAREFLLLPVELYKNDKNWVRPLDNDINNVFDEGKNPFFKHGECVRWLLRDEVGKCVGRVAAFIDRDACHLDSRGGFRSFRPVSGVAGGQGYGGDGGTGEFRRAQ